MSIEDRDIPEMSVDELIDYVEEDDIPTSEFTVEDTDRMVILGKLNAVLEWLKHHRGTDIYSNDEFLETYNIDLKLDKSVYDAFILSLDEILNDIADTLETIPTKTSELDNDSGYITLADIPTIPTKTSELVNDSGFITLADIPTIPTKTSELVNDSGFITDSYHDSTKQDTLTFDTTPTANSQNPVTSGGIFTALASREEVADYGTGTRQWYVRFKSGLQICWGYANNLINNGEITFEKPFTTARVMITQRGVTASWNDNMKVNGNETTKFTVNSGGTTNIDWIAIGLWDVNGG